MSAVGTVSCRGTLEDIRGCVGHWVGCGTCDTTDGRVDVADAMVVSDLGEPYFVFERLMRAPGGVLARLTGFVACAEPGQMRTGMALDGGFVQLAEGPVVASDDGGFDAHLLADVWSHPDWALVDATEMWIGCHGDELTLSVEVLHTRGTLTRTTSVLTRRLRRASSRSASPLGGRATRWFG